MTAPATPPKIAAMIEPPNETTAAANATAASAWPRSRGRCPQFRLRFERLHSAYARGRTNDPISIAHNQGQSLARSTRQEIASHDFVDWARDVLTQYDGSKA